MNFSLLTDANTNANTNANRNIGAGIGAGINTGAIRRNVFSANSIEMVPSETLSMYHPVIGDIDDIVLGPDNFHRLRVTKTLNDFFTSGQGFQDIQDTPGFFPIVYFYQQLLARTEVCFGEIDFNGFAIYNYDDISRLGLEFYIYYTLDQFDISLFALFAVSQKTRVCEIWNLCKTPNAQIRGNAFLSEAIAHARLEFNIQMFWLGISFHNTREGVTKLFELYHSLGFTEPLLTNMSNFGKDTRSPLLELVLYPDVFDDSNYTRAIFEYFLRLFYENQIQFSIIEFPRTFRTADSKSVSVIANRELLPTDYTNKENLSRSLGILKGRRETGFEKNVSLPTMHRLLVLDTPVEVAGVLHFVRVTPNYIQLDEIASLNSTVETTAVSNLTKFGPVTFHTHPFRTMQMLKSSLAWPSTPDITTCMFGIAEEVLVHFVFTTEGIYILRNNYLFLSFQTNFISLFGTNQSIQFYNHYKELVLNVTLFLEEMRKDHNVLPLGLVRHTRDNWLGYMNSLTISELIPGVFVPKVTPERRQYTREMVEAISVSQEAFDMAIQYMQIFAEGLRGGDLTEEMEYFGTKMLRLPLYNLDFIPSELLSSHKISSVLYASSPALRLGR